MQLYYTRKRLVSAHILIPFLCIVALGVSVYVLVKMGWIALFIYMMILFGIIMLGCERCILLQKGYWLQNKLYSFNYERIKELFDEEEQFEIFIKYLQRKINKEYQVSAYVFPGELLLDYYVHVENTLLCVTLSPNEKKIVKVKQDNSVV